MKITPKDEPIDNDKTSFQYSNHPYGMNVKPFTPVQMIYIEAGSLQTVALKLQELILALSADNSEKPNNLKVGDRMRVEGIFVGEYEGNGKMQFDGLCPGEFVFLDERIMDHAVKVEEEIINEYEFPKRK